MDGRHVKGEMRDKALDASTYSADVTVDNVAPTATFNNNGPVNEGSNISLSLTSPSDPSSVDTAAGFEYRFSCDNGSTWSAWSSDNTASCSTNDNGTRHVKGEIRDKDLDARTYSADVTVNNVAPTVTVDGDSPVNEGSTHTYTFTVTDPGTADTFTVDSGYPKCGTGGNYETGTLSLNLDGSGGSFKCPFPDGPTTTNVSMSVHDDDDAASNMGTEAVKVVDVANVAPTATLSNNGPVDEGSPATVTFTNQLDPSGPDTSAGFHYEYNCDGSVFTTAPTYATADTS